MRLANINLLLFVGNHCQRESTLTIVSSECSRPLSGVTLYSRNYMAIVSSSNGRYRIRACSLPLYVTLKKYGYRTMRVIVRRSTEKFTMRCLGMFIDHMVVSCCCLCYHMVLGDTTLVCITSVFMFYDSLQFSLTVYTSFVRPVPQVYMLQIFDLTQFVQMPTRVTQASSTLIDHVYSSHPENITNCFVSALSISDHFPICFTRKINSKIPKMITI